jgi:hypothetical protein
MSKPVRDVLLPALTHQELMTLWAGLRMIQCALNVRGDGGFEVNREQVVKQEHFEEVPPLTNQQIDKLIDRFSLGPHNVEQRQTALKQGHKALRGLSNDAVSNALRAMVNAFDCWPDNPKKTNPPKG